MVDVEKGDKEGTVHKVIGESQVIMTSLKKSLPLTLDITTFLLIKTQRILHSHHAAMLHSIRYTIIHSLIELWD